MEVPKRLTPKTSTLNLLLLRSGNQCAFEKCSEVLFNDNNELITECCHIESALPGGERFNINQTNEERRSYDNLLFLCHKHHIETDNVNIYTVEKLKEIKEAHHKKFSEKEVVINPKHLNSTIDKFNKISSNIEETLSSVKRVEFKQDSLIELLSISNKLKPSIQINEFYGQPATPNFLGRKGEINRIETDFHNFNTFIIQGISGTGKSSLAAHIVSRVDTHQILWIACDNIDSKELFITTLSKFLVQNFDDFSLEACLSEKNKRIIENNLIHVLKKHSICIVFDALNSTDHNLFSYIQVFNEKLDNSKVIISTTQDFSIMSWSNQPFKLPLKGVSKETFAELCKLYSINNLNIEGLNSLYTLTGGHPYLLKLAASILIYQPINNFIAALKNRTINEIEDYIKHKIISELNLDETRFLMYATALEIPFRYKLGTYIINLNVSSVIKSLQQIFLIEQIHNGFYIIPEFIKLYLIELNKSLIEKQDLEILIEYLKNIDESPTIIEKRALINILLKVGFDDSAKDECSQFISYLMGNGHFNLVAKYSNDFLKNDIAKKWSILFYALGRVYRIRKEYEESLNMYNKGIGLGSNSRLHSHFLFEKASILFYLSIEKEIEEYKDEAKNIYYDLSKLINLSISIQSELGLARILVYENKQEEAISRIKKIIDTIDFGTTDSHIAAQIWQSLGDAYSKNDEHKRAFDSFDKSIDLYAVAMDQKGLNVFEGLYHLYISYGTTYSNGKDYVSAAEMFAINVSLAKQFGLEKKVEQSLLDLGYHLVLSEQYVEAIDILNEYYNLANEKETLSVLELPFIFGCLLFANWYSGKFIEAVELIGLYCNASLLSGRRPLITIIEGNDKVDEFNLIEYFKKGMKTLIMPADKSIIDFQNWIKEVCSKRPELTKTFNDFYKFEKK